LGITRSVNFLDMKTYAGFTDMAGGRTLDITGDMDSLQAGMAAISPADARRIEAFIAAAHFFARSGVGDIGMDRPYELMSFRAKARLMSSMLPMLRFYIGKYGRPVADYAERLSDPWLRWIVRNMFLPEVPVWFMSMVLGLVAGGRMGLLEEGSLAFALAIEKTYKELGGEISYRATVDKILVDENRAVGVRLEDGREFRADIVISAGDGYSTIYTLLDGQYTDKKIDERYRTWKLVRPLVMISFGVDREFSGEPWLNMIRLDRPFAVGDRSIEAIMVRIFNYSTKFAPAGKTVVQAGFESDWDYWNDLQPDRTGYESAKERAAAKLLTRLETVYPGISGLVEMTDVATPYTTWRYTLNHKGAYEGWLPTAEIITRRIERTLPGLENFYMAGQWVSPGGGVPPCLYSGRQAIQVICHRDGKPFRNAMS
jgi:phytoene dehydrogenase-like protein